jgi:arylformamidase
MLPWTDPMVIMGLKEIYDISILMGKEDVCYPGDAPYSREEISSIQKGASYNLSTLTLSAHTGTHIDAPAHFRKGAKTIDRYPAGYFLIPAHVVEVDDEESIKPNSLKSLEIERDEALLFKTFNSNSGLSCSGSFSEKYVYMSETAAHLCVDLKVRLVGIDYLSIDRYSDDTAPVHRILLRNDVLILEGIDLKSVPAGRYMLFCPPLKLMDGEASPVRALLLR